MSGGRAVRAGYPEESKSKAVARDSGQIQNSDLRSACIYESNYHTKLSAQDQAVGHSVVAAGNACGSDYGPNLYHESCRYNHFGR